MFLIIVIGLIGFGLYELVTTVYTVPNRQTKKSIKRLTQQKKLSEDLREFFVDPISKVILKFIKIFLTFYFYLSCFFHILSL